MKSKIFFRSIVSLLFAGISALPSEACGPYSPIIPTPEYFCLSRPVRTIADYERQENLRLWQAATDAGIPLGDIEEAVYRDSSVRFRELTGRGHEKTANRFYAYLNSTNDREITDLLTCAKELEEEREKMRDPWYYPQHRNGAGITGDFDPLIRRLRAYHGRRLRDRYSLQVARALFASGRYASCIAYTDSAFADIPDSNLMKRMALRYKAGCLSRLGNTAAADTIFAVTGDIMSVSGEKAVALMSELNPGAPMLIEYIRHQSRRAPIYSPDTAFMESMVPVARRMLRDRRVTDKGDWLFLLAYVSGEFDGKPYVARKEIHRAMGARFSSDELRDLAHAYKMKIDARTGNMKDLLSDLTWIESLTAQPGSDAYEWVRRCQNIIYAELVPRLWRKKDYATAILACSYADNLAPDRSEASEYGCLSFRLMGSLTSEKLAECYKRVTSDSPLYAFLRKKARTDRDYYYELVGTLALREENYKRAEQYLSLVSEQYLKDLNTNKGGYLSRDPFMPYRSRWATVTYTYGDYDDEQREYESPASGHLRQSCHGAKLDFARRMLGYRERMKHGRTADDRGLARLMYAIGRRNSFEECWALTQYWRGYCSTLFDPRLYYWTDDHVSDSYRFLYDYETTVGHKDTENIYDREVAASLAMLRSDEARAKAEYALCNLKTVVRRYGSTETARLVKTSCDNWHTWL